MNLTNTINSECNQLMREALINGNTLKPCMVDYIAMLLNMVDNLDDVTDRNLSVIEFLSTTEANYTLRPASRLTY